MEVRKTVVFDFDGVINSYKTGYSSEEIKDPPVKGIKEAIEKIRKYYNVIVVSSRCSTLEGLHLVTRYLEDNGITVDGIMSEKPPAVCYIDDRAICFDGNAASLSRKVREFVPWHQKKYIKFGSPDGEPYEVVTYSNYVSQKLENVTVELIWLEGEKDPIIEWKRQEDTVEHEPVYNTTKGDE